MSVNHIFRQLTAGISFNTKSFAGDAKRFGLAKTKENSVADPNPDPHVFGPPVSGSGSTSQRYGSGSGSFYHHAKIVRKTLIPTIL
jgi:hypothetical protein